MWLFSSSVGRKFIMALTGACLVLFVTFHCVMNAICICWPATYNSICEFLGANWYALLASIGLAFLVVLHIVYACWLTLQNRKARGDQRYLVNKRPASVEWSSKNMLVLGVVILAFLVVHLIQFWAKMQLQEIRGGVEVIPATAGTLFLQEAFGLVWTPIVYIIGFIALWFHMNHGFWSMFESVGWTNNDWIRRLKKIGAWWVSIVVVVFIAQAIVFTVRAHEGYYKTDSALRAQYQEMVGAMWEKDFGPDAAQMKQFYTDDMAKTYNQLSPDVDQIKEMADMDLATWMTKANVKNYEQSLQEASMYGQGDAFKAEFPNEEAYNDNVRKSFERQSKFGKRLLALYDLYAYLLDKPNAEQSIADNARLKAEQEKQMQQQMQQMQQPVIDEVEAEEVVAEEEVPANNNQN